MMRQRLIAFLMVLVQVAALEYMLFGFEWFPVVLAVAALAAVPGMARIKLGRRSAVAVSAVLAVFIWYGTQTFLFSQRLPVLPYLTGYTYPLGWYVLTLETALLFLRTRDNRVPVYFPVLGIAVMAYAGLAGRHGALDPTYHAASLIFIMLMILFWTPETTPGREVLPASVKGRGVLMQGGLILAAFAVAVPLSTFIGVYRTDIDMAFFSALGGMTGTSALGFSTHTRLGSIGFLAEEEGEKVALRVVSQRAPGYLRGRAYDQYRSAQWNVTTEERPLPAVAQPIAGTSTKSGMNLFKMRDGQPPYKTIKVAPAAEFEGCLFAPMDACFIGLFGAVPTGDAIGNLRVLPTMAASEYEIVTAPATQQDLTNEIGERATALPADLDPAVRHLAARLFKDCPTTRDKIAATVAYFKDNYRYNLGIDIPAGENPMTYFLLEQPPAHCEYFATGAAILLRLGGVPCRYVTGFVAAERNAIGKYWLARNKDAHAWVEAWDDDRQGWVLVEATVAEGVPEADQHRLPGLFAQLKDYAGYVRQQIRASLAAGSWKKMLHQTRLGLWGCAVVSLAGLVAIARYTVRKWAAHSPRRRPAPSLESKTLLRLRKKVDRKIHRYGFVRAPEETILSFANRITSAERPDSAVLRRTAQWYRRYNEVRFRYPLRTQRLEQLKRALQESVRFR